MSGSFRSPPWRAGRPGLRGAFQAAGFRPAKPRSSPRDTDWPANWTLVQGLLMWALSRNSECGRVTETRATLALAPAWGKVSSALSAGLPVCLVEPEIAMVSLGAKGRMRAVGDLEVS